MEGRIVGSERGSDPMPSGPGVEALYRIPTS